MSINILFYIYIKHVRATSTGKGGRNPAENSLLRIVSPFETRKAKETQASLCPSLGRDLKAVGEP